MTKVALVLGVAALLALITISPIIWAGKEGRDGESRANMIANYRRHGRGNSLILTPFLGLIALGLAIASFLADPPKMLQGVLLVLASAFAGVVFYWLLARRER